MRLRLTLLLVLLLPSLSIAQPLKWDFPDLPVGRTEGVFYTIEDTILSISYDIYASTDQGRSWQPYGTPLNGEPGALVRYGSTLIGFSDVANVISTDLGRTWRSRNDSLPYYSRCPVYKANDTLFWAAGDTIFLSTDTGKIWKRWTQIPQIATIECLCFSPTGRVYAGTSDNLQVTYPRVFETTDRGGSWHAIQTEPLANFVTQIYEVDSTYLVLASDGGVKALRRTGNTWSTVFLTPVAFEEIRSVLALDSTTIFTASRSRGIRRTTDAGANWTSVDSTHPWSAVSLLLTKDGHLLASMTGTPHGTIARSHDPVIGQNSIESRHEVPNQAPILSPQRDGKIVLAIHDYSESSNAIFVYNSAGQKVAEWIGNPREGTEIASRLSSGMYLVRFHDKGLWQTIKVLVQ